MIQVNEISICYKEKDREYLAVNNLSLTFESGSFTSIVGRSGSGKTSLLNAIGGILLPISGEIIVDDMNIYRLSNKELAKYRSQHIGYIFQNFYLEECYTVEQNIEIALMIGGYPLKRRKERIDCLLENVGMKDEKKKKVGKLSGGERQRICIARALANDPNIILADEPCGNLDSYNGAIIMNHLQNLSQKGKTVILVTHNLEDAKKTERIIELKDGIVFRDEKNGYTPTGLE